MTSTRLPAIRAASNTKLTMKARLMPMKTSFMIRMMNGSALMGSDPSRLSMAGKSTMESITPTAIFTWESI